VYGGSYGWSSAGRFHHAQSQLHRFLNCLGGYVRGEHSYSNGAQSVIMPHVVGSMREFLDRATAWSVLERHTELVCIGGIPITNTMGRWMGPLPPIRAYDPPAIERRA
jgi:biotin/methionine sulfoxide reductase